MKPCRTLWLVDVVCAGVFADLLGKGLLRWSFNLSEKNSTSRAQGRTWCKQVKQPVLVLCCLLNWFMLRGGEGNGASQPLCSQTRESVLAALREALSEE